MKISTCPVRPILEDCTLEAFDHQIEPYVGCTHLCRYCYALNQAETDWSREIMVHGDIAGQLERELQSIPPQGVYMGWRTDPYQPCEQDRRQTRQVLEVLAGRGFSAHVLTKSDLILRDLDLFGAMDAPSASFSLAFEDEAVRELFETNTRPTRARIEALKECAAAGLGVSAMICPVIPYVTDVLPLIEAVAGHVDKAWVFGLSILDESEASWQNLIPVFERHYPDQYGQIKKAVFDREHHYWGKLRQAIQDRFGQRGFELSIHF